MVPDDVNKMLGDVVQLFLCRTCKGLFILESQVEKHAADCNGEAFKSPANLFACEREHYLELIAPNVAGTKTNKISLASERKRRKTSPIISNKSDAFNTRRSFLSKDDLSTLSSGSYYGMGTPQLWDTSTDYNKSVVRSRSLSQPKSQPNNLLYTDKVSKTAPCSLQQNVLQQNILNTVVSLSTPVSQPFAVPVNDGTNTFPGCFPQKKTETSFSTNLNQTRHESVDSESATIQKNSTPATNLLAYLSQLQQGDESVTQSKVLIGQEQMPSLAGLPNNADEPSDLYTALDSDPVNGTCALKQSSIVQSSSPLGTTETNQQVKIVSGEVLNLDTFPLKPTATVTTVDCTPNSTSVHEFLPIVSESGDKGDGEDSVRIDRAETTACTKDKTGTSMLTDSALKNCDKSVQLQEDGNQILGFDNTEVELFQTKCTTAHAFSKTEISISETPLKQDNNIQGQVVYIFEPDGILLPVAVENVMDKSSEVSNSLALTVGIGAVDITDHNTLPAQVSESLTFAGGDSDNSTLVQTVSTEVIESENYVKSTNVMPKAKSKHQLRLEELSALREEVLLQATEIPPDAESKKTRYRCKVCGHVAKSVKFMHNHLQMHADGKVFFECDQCDFKHRLRSKLVEHQQRHNRSKLLCHLCPATFMDVASLNRHIAAKHTDNEGLKCDLCPFTASYPSLMKDHMLKHTGDLYSCTEEGCKYKTPYLRALRVHQKRHTSEKNYRCSMCSYEAVEKSTLDRHMKSHTQERPYQCSHCSFRANTRHAVVLHMQHKHEEQKSFYACDKCPFRTAYASSIAKHLKTHMGPFTCPLCKHSTSNLISIKKHFHQAHQEENIPLVDSPAKINTKDYLQTESDKPMIESSKPLMDSLMTDTMNVDSQDFPPLPVTDIERSHIDPMKLSFHFHDLAAGPYVPSSSSNTNLTRSSSIPDLFTFSGMNRSNSQSDLLNCPGISTMTRSNSMSDLVTFASSMCTDSGEPVNMDVSLSDASAPSMDVGGLSLGDGPEVSLAEGERPGSPLSAMFVLQCSKCLALLMNEEDVDSHKKICTGTVLMV